MASIIPRQPKTAVLEKTEDIVEQSSMSAPLNVWSMIFYLTEVEGMTWRQEDYVAKKITDAVKGRPINRYFEVSVGGVVRRFDQDNIQTFMPSLFQTVASKLQSLLQGPVEYPHP